MERFKNALGESGRLLITTRNAGIATALNGQRYDIDLLTESESLLLLAEWSGCTASDLPPAALAALAECGRLPLAVSMIGAMMKGKPADRWNLVLQDLKSANLDEIRQAIPNYDHPDLLRALKISVDALAPPGDDSESWERKVQARRRYLDLAVFPGNAPIPATLLFRYWGPQGVSESLATKLTDLFAERNLARRDEHGRIVLHDLQHDYLVSEQRATIGDLHERFLNCVRPPEGWQHASDDGYLLEHLAEHLQFVGLKEELNALVNRSWMDKRLAASGSYRGFSDDVEASIDDRDTSSPEGLIGLARKRLLIGTIAELATQAPSSSFGSMAAVGLVDQAIHQASLIRNRRHRMEALSELAAVLVDQGNSGSARPLIEQILEGVETLRSIDPEDRDLQILCFAWGARCLAQLELPGAAEKAIQCTRSLLDAKTKENVRAKVLENLSRASFHLGRKTEARRLAHQVFENAQRRYRVQMELLRDATLLFMDLGDEENLSKAIRLLTANDSVRKSYEVMQAAIAIAQQLALNGRKAQAVELAESVRKAIPKPLRKDQIAPMLGATALVFARVGQKAKAETIAKRALAMLKGKSHYERLSVLFDLASMALALGQKVRAAALVRRTFKLISAESAADALSDSGVAAELLYQAGQHDEARRFFEDALSSAWKVQRSWNALHTAGIIAEALIRMGRVDEGVAQLEGLSGGYGALGTAQKRVSRVLAEVGSWDAAESVALSSKDIYRPDALRQVAGAIARSGAHERARKLVDSIAEGIDTRLRACRDGAFRHCSLIKRGARLCSKRFGLGGTKDPRRKARTRGIRRDCT